MQTIVSIGGVVSAKILVEDISNECRRRRKNEVDVALSRIDTYIRSSLRTAFAQRMEKADSSRRASRNKLNSLPTLAILAKDVAGVAVATLHACYGNELKQIISGITELTPDAVQILRAADKLEKDLVHIAVEDSVDSGDGGKAIIREMPPYEAEGAIANLVKAWIKTRIDRLKEWVDRNLQQEVLRIVDETLEAFFELPIPMHPALLPDLVAGLDKCLQYYATKAKSGCGSKNSYIPSMPALTRCTTGSTFQWKKKEKSTTLQKRNPQVATVNGDSSIGVPQLCVRINSLHKITFGAGRCREKNHNPTEELRICPRRRFLKWLRKEVRTHSAYLHRSSPTTIRRASLQNRFPRPEPRSMGFFIRWRHFRKGEDSDHSWRDESFVRWFLMVLLAGGPTRAFSKQDSPIIEDDFKALKDLFWADGDVLLLPEDIIEKFSSLVRDVLPLLRTDTESIVERFRRLTLESYGSSAKARLPLPATSGQWSSTEPNTLLRVLCYRNDEAESRFLKKTYNLPKKL
ncbi:hypothetical protein OROMI_004665 [Orobanche minor]